MRTSTIVLLSVLLNAPLVASAQPDDVTFIEGHVFSKFTGVPLQGAVVEVFANVNTAPPGGLGHPIATARTDGNGFYSIEWDEVEDAILLVSCGDAAGGFRQVQNRLGTIRRDVYVDVGWRRRFSKCPGVVESDAR